MNVQLIERHLDFAGKESIKKKDPTMKMAIIISGLLLALLMATILVIASITVKTIRSKEDRDLLRYGVPEQSSLRTKANIFNSVNIKIYGQFGVSVKDPFGRMMTIDPYGKVSPDEITPSSSFKVGRGAESDCKEFSASHAESGDYHITIIGSPENTPVYTMEIHALNSNHERLIKCFENIPYIPGISHQYLFHFNCDNMRECYIKGGYTTVNKRDSAFFSYANLNAPSIKLPVGISLFSMIIFYDLAIIPDTFRAKCNDIIISNLFNKHPGGWDVITINLNEGDNIITLSADGIGADNIETHTDKFLIIADIRE